PLNVCTVALPLVIDGTCTRCTDRKCRRGANGYTLVRRLGRDGRRRIHCTGISDSMDRAVASQNIQTSVRTDLKIDRRAESRCKIRHRVVSRIQPTNPAATVVCEEIRAYITRWKLYRRRIVKRAARDCTARDCPTTM